MRRGGALFGESAPEALTIEACRFDGNQADSMGGALSLNFCENVTIAGSRFCGGVDEGFPLCADSPCNAGNSPGGEPIGAWRP